jgi:hypothetical protein
LNHLARRDHYHYRQHTTTHQHFLPYSDRLQAVLVVVVESAEQKL